MAKDRKKLIHIHSSIPDKQPTPQSLAVGEIAVNNAADQEFLSIKNSEDKVKRFSSDEQMITWMEKKEVMPYVGYVRGGAGPSATSAATPTADIYGSYGIQTSDLVGNTSEIIIKLNQVAASATTKHERVNGSKDRYNKDVNPTTDSGVNDGAGFFIDMSRYAMQGANPEFSGITNTCYTNLNGTTKIKGVNGACGSLLEITVNSAKTDIETANTEITSATTVIGTNTTTISGNTTINVSGTTTETRIGNVTENHSGTTTDNNKGNVIVNNQTNFNMNTSGNTTVTTTGDTVIHSDGAVGITAVGNIVATSSESSIIVTANDDLCETAGDVAAFKGMNKTNVGIDCSDAGRTKVTNVYGDTINKRANTADTRVTSAYTSATTATTIIGTANTSATTATLSGNTLVVNEATSISAKTPTAYVSGTTLDVKETNTDITSCGRISANTNDFEVKQCAANGKAIINSDDIDISGKTFDVVEATSAAIKAPATTISGTSLTLDEGTSISAKTPSTTISGTNFTLNETNTTINSCGKVEITTDSYSLKQCSASGGSAEFEFCNGYTVKSNKISLQQCGSAGTISISAQTQNIDGGNLTINESGNTAINTTGTTNVKSTGNTNIETNGANNKVTIQASGTGGDVEVFAKDTLCMSGGSTAALVGTTNTNIGKNCSDGGQTTTLNLNGTTINETGTTVNISGSSAANISGVTVVLSGNTTNISGETTLNLSGKTVNVDATDIDVDASNNYCLSAATKANIYGKTTNIGVECGGTTATTINISGTTINEGGTTNNNNFTTVNNTATTINNKTTNFNITGTTYISGDTTMSGNTTIGNDLTIPIPCTGITSTTVNMALCEVLSRGEVSWNVGDYPATDENLKWFELWQNGSQIKDQNGNAVRIDIPKDHILKDVAIVYGKANGSSFTACTSSSNDCHWYIKLVWNVNDPSTGHSNDKTVYLPSDDFIKDIDDNNDKADRGVNVDVWYDGKQNWVSADTTVKIETDGNGTKTFTKSAGEHSLNSYKLTLTHNGLTNAEFDPFNASTALTLPHSALSIDYGADVADKTDDSYDTSEAKTIYIPTSVKNLSNWNGSCYEFDGNLCITGTVTASGAIYSSDRNLKENIKSIDADDISKVGAIDLKSFNFIDDESKTKIYGVIAQEVQEAGLDILVHQKEDGMLGVDYTSFLILKIAQLQRDNNNLVNFVASLDKRVKELEEKLEKKD